tara:strand:+ start:981 stop:1319 length:339 start_codon:yes stop_codon:yes gene_type:complete
MRYDRRQIVNNQNEMYIEQRKRRGKSVITQYTTPFFKEPDTNDLEAVDTEQHLWAHGDKFYKLAHRFYGDSKFWWVIARFNRLPTESHVKVGDLIFIPVPLSDILKFYGMYY